MFVEENDNLSENINRDKADKLTSENSSVHVDENLKGSIEAEAFQGNQRITSICTRNITAIEDRAFKDCTRLKAINIQNIERIGDDVFENCTELCWVDVKNEDMAEMIIKKLIECKLKQRIDIHIDQKFKVSIENGQAYLFYDTVRRLLRGNEITIPSCNFIGSLEYIIPYRAFSYISRLSKLNADAATIVEDFAFADCENLEEVSLLGIKKIGWRAFLRCNKLRKVHADDSMVKDIKEVLNLVELPQQVCIYVNGSIADYLHDDLNKTIYYNEKYDKDYDYLEIPDHYIRIGDNIPFDGIKKINTNKVTTIGNNVFSMPCKVEEIYLPNVQEIGNDFCSNCGATLKKIIVKDKTMANLIKDMFGTYDTSVDNIDIYIDGESEPFLTINNNSKFISKDDALSLINGICSKLEIDQELIENHTYFIKIMNWEEGHSLNLLNIIEFIRDIAENAGINPTKLEIISMIKRISCRKYVIKK